MESDEIEIDLGTAFKGFWLNGTIFLGNGGSSII